MIATLQVGKSCNNNCIHCSNVGMKADHDKTTAELIAEIDLLKDKGASWITFPCNADRREDFPSLVKHVMRAGIKTVLISNGRMLSYSPFVNEIHDHIDFVRIPFHHLSEAQYQQITRTDGHSQMRQGVNNVTQNGMRLLNNQPTGILSPLNYVDEGYKLLWAGATEYYFGLSLEGLTLGSHRVPTRRACLESEEELDALVGLSESFNIPINAALNKLLCNEDELAEFPKHLELMRKHRIKNLILTNLNVLMNADLTGFRLIASSLLSTMNKEAVSFLKSIGCERVILDQQITLDDLQEICSQDGNPEIEAFIFYTRCRNIDSLCRYRLIAKNKHAGEHTCYFPSKATLTKGSATRLDIRGIENKLLLRRGGHCGGCSLYHFIKNKVTSVKIVGRGFSTEQKIIATDFISKAIGYYSEGESEEEYQKKIRQLYQETFDEDCGRCCYYPHFHHGKSITH